MLPKYYYYNLPTHLTPSAVLPFNISVPVFLLSYCFVCVLEVCFIVNDFNANDYWIYKSSFIILKLINFVFFISSNNCWAWKSGFAEQFSVL